MKNKFNESSDDFDDDTEQNNKEHTFEKFYQKVGNSFIPEYSDLIIDKDIKGIIKEPEPIQQTIYSLEPDYKMGWRPSINYNGIPIPLLFDYEDDRILSYLDDKRSQIIYYGYRPQDSLHMHETFARKGKYPFNFPSRSDYMLIDITRQIQSK